MQNRYLQSTDDVKIVNKIKISGKFPIYRMREN